MDKILKMNTRMQTSIMILFGALVFAMKLTNVNVEEFSKENQLIAILIIVFVVTSMLNLVITTVLLLKIRRKKERK